jgi:hypothetical protein
MFHTSQTLHPAPTVLGAGCITSHFENSIPCKLIDDRERLFDDFVRRLHALVCGEE